MLGVRLVPQCKMPFKSFFFNLLFTEFTYDFSYYMGEIMDGNLLHIGRGGGTLLIKK